MVQVGAAVILGHGRVLACQRNPHGTHAGRWEFPGGKRQSGESLADCVRRELREELAIECVVGAELWRSRYAYREGVRVDIFFFVVPAYQGEISNQIFADVRWVEPGQLSGLDFLDADRPLVAWLDRL